MFFCINFTTLMELRFLLAFWPGNCIWQAFSSCWLCRRRNTWKCWRACPERSRSIFRGILCYSWKRHVLDRRKNRRRTGEIPNISGHKPRPRHRISGCDPLLWREWAIRYLCPAGISPKRLRAKAAGQSAGLQSAQGHDAAGRNRQHSRNQAVRVDEFQDRARAKQLDGPLADSGRKRNWLWKGNAIFLKYKIFDERFQWSRK